MTEQLKQALQAIVNLSDEQKVELGKDNLNKFLNGLARRGIPKDQLPDILFNFVKFFVSADGKTTQGEYEFFVNVTNIRVSPQEFADFAQSGDLEALYKSAYEFAAMLIPEDKEALALFGAALLSADDTITNEEANMIDRLINAQEQ